MPVDKVKAIDTTGAGDAFVGSLAYFMAQGKPLLEAMRRANRLAAISVQASGTQTSFPEAKTSPRNYSRNNAEKPGFSKKPGFRPVLKPLKTNVVLIFFTELGVV